MSHHLTTSLPSEFISNHKPLFPNHHHHALYDFASSSSTESDSDDDDLTGLTRHFTRSVSLQDTPHLLQNKRVFSGSPESTLNWNISGSGHTQVRSSPTTPFSQPNENSLDLIYAAAEQVARMKMNINMKMKMNAMNDAVFPNGGLIGAPRPVGASLPHHHHHHHLPPLWTENEDFIRQQQLRRRLAGVCNYNSGGRCGTGRAGGPVGFSESAWPHVPVETQRRAQPANLFAVKPVNGGFNGGSERVVKKERAGTGVFLPRNYCNVVPETKKKQGGLVEWMKKDMDPMMVQQQPQPHNLKRDELMELVIARRNAVMLLAQQRRSGANAIVAETRKGQGEIVLPQEWTY